MTEGGGVEIDGLGKIVGKGIPGAPIEFVQDEPRGLRIKFMIYASFVSWNLYFNVNESRD